MEKIFQFLVLFSISVLINSQSTYYFTLSEPYSIKDQDNREIHCLGSKNTISGIEVTFGSRGISTDGSFVAQRITNILGAKLANNKGGKDVPLVCEDNGARFFCNADLGLGTKLDPGEYNFVAEEEISGSPVPAAIRAITSQRYFTVKDDFYQRFPFSSIEQRAEFIKGKFDFTVDYPEDIYKPLKMTDGKKQYDCHIKDNDRSVLVCPLKEEDFPLGGVYQLSFVNICGESEGKITITSVMGESHETDIFMVYILPTILFVVVVVVIVAIVILVKLGKRRGDKDLGEIMQTSYADEDKQKQKKGEGAGQETLV